MPFKIFKFEIPIMKEIITIDLPQGAKILKVDTQNNIPVFWASFNVEDDDTFLTMDTRYFKVCVTGEFISEMKDYQYEYLGTVQLNRGSFIGHFYEIL